MPAFLLPSPLLKQHFRAHQKCAKHKPVLSATPRAAPPPPFPVRYPLIAPPARQYVFSPSVVQSLRLRHCLVATKALADYIFAEVKAGRRELQDIARELSLCEASRGQGGDFGWVERGKWIDDGGLCKELWLEVAGMRPGVLGVVHWSGGWSVVKVEDCRHSLNVKRGRSRRGKAIVDDDVKVGGGVDLGSYAVKTMGCQMNSADSERMKGELERLGYRESDDEQRAEIVVLNTCSIREHAELKVYSFLGRQVQRKMRNQGKITLVVAGCVAQQEGEKLLRRVPELDVVLGPQYANRLGDLLEDVKVNQSQVVATDPTHISEDLSKPKRSSSVTAWVNAQLGCSERCAYCVVPTVRGLEQSRPMDAIKKEVEDLAASGYKEVVLLGQNVDAYGRDMYPRVTLSDLLRHIHDVEGIERIRFTTSHPRYISDNLVNTVAELPKVVEAFLIPPQSGNDLVLKRMVRGYDSRRYRDIVKRIRTRIPEASISGDVIVGFPGETEEQFQDSLKLLEDVVFDTVHTAAYSPRPNTPAAEWEEQVDEDVKSDRLARINRMVNEHAMQRSEQLIGQVQEVLVEGVNEKMPEQAFGRNRGIKRVYFEGDGNSLKGKVVYVKVEKAFTFSVYGKLVSVRD